MRRIRSFFLIFIAAIFSVLLSAPALAENTNLVKNPTFEKKISKWSRYAWIQENAIIESKDGVLLLSSDVANHVSIQQQIAVKAKTVYRISAQVKVQNIVMDGGSGACFGIDYSTAMLQADPAKDDWQSMEFYVRTMKRQKGVKLNLSLGDYGNLASGIVQFKDIRFEKVDATPNGVDIMDIDNYADNSETDGELPVIVMLAELWRNVLFAALGAALLYAVYKWSIRSGWRPSNGAADNMAVIILITGFILRLVLTVMSEGYPNDTGTFAAWSNNMVEFGPSRFYTESDFADYPPGMMYLLWFSGLLNRAMGITVSTSGAGLMILMLPVLIADIATIIIAYRYSVEKWGNMIGLGVCILLTFLPATLFDGAIWHQVDPILTLSLIVTFILLDKKKLIAAGAAFGLAILLKPQALMAGPAFAMVYVLHIFDAWKEKKEGMQVAKAIGKTALAAVAALVVIFVLALPFQGNQPNTWLVEKYYTTGTSYPYASVNAYNLFALMGHNFLPETDQIPLLPIRYNMLGNILILLVIAVTVVFAFASHKKKTFDIYLLTAFLLMGIFCLGPRMHERYAYPALIFLIITWIKIRDKGVMKAFLLLGASMTANMAMALYSLNHVLPKTAGFETLVVVISFCNLLGFIYLTMICYDIFVGGKVTSDLSDTADYMALSRPEGEGNRQMQNDIAEETIEPSEANENGEDTAPNDTESTEPMVKNESAPSTARERWLTNPFIRAKQSLDALPLKGGWWTRRDSWIVLALTAIYAVIAFFHLGTTNVPETYWRGAPNQSVVIDFGEVKTVSSIWVYGGICDGTLTFAPEQNEAEPVASFALNYDMMYRWSVNALSNTFTTDKLVMSIDGDTWMTELVFMDAQGNVITPKGQVVVREEEPADSIIAKKHMEVSTDSDSNVAHLFDEQNRKPDRPDAYNGMYFDELYHGRTAYEHLHGLKPYEFTHPPLGKIMIMTGIVAFGMNPFGWRFVGTLIGVAMVPIFYALAKRLLKKTNFAAFATIFFTFDFMHFAQTRLSTIDVYSVFFVLLMYYFMLEYWQMSFYTDGLKKTLRPLGLSGLFFALGAASKWTCIYAGIGLGVLFFASLYRRMNEYYLARSALAQETEGTEAHAVAEKYVKQTSVFVKNTILTLAFCVLMFIIVPFIVYFLSYIPYPFFQLDKPVDTLRSFVDMQRSMFHYHNGLVSRHPFESNWLSWMVDGRPIWYFSAQNEFLPAPFVASIASFGNPIVWWASILGLIGLIYYGIRTKFTDKNVFFLLVGFGAQFVPWMMVSRATFIYHYFGSVPFLVLSLTYVLMQWYKKEKRIKNVMIVLAILAVALFVMFYPALSAMPIPSSYAQFLEWFPSWQFFSIRR